MLTWRIEFIGRHQVLAWSANVGYEYDVLSDHEKCPIWPATTCFGNEIANLFVMIIVFWGKSGIGGVFRDVDQGKKQGGSPFPKGNA